MRSKPLDHPVSNTFDSLRRNQREQLKRKEREDEKEIAASIDLSLLLNHGVADTLTVFMCVLLAYAATLERLGQTEAGCGPL